MFDDHQDDLGTFLRQVVPEIAASQFVKEASWREKSDTLDRDFAVILVEPNGREHKKLAMFDAGNTLASIAYLLKKDHSLPDSAIKLASYNLLNAAMHQGLFDAYGHSLLFNEKLGSAFDVLAALADNLSGDSIIDARRVGVTKEAMQGMSGYDPKNKTVAVTGPMPPNMNMMQQQIPGAMGAQEPSTVIKHATSFDLIKEATWSWPELDPVEKRELAFAIKVAAEEEGASMPDFIYQYTGTELNPMFERLMKQRQDYTANTELQNDYDRLAKVAHVMDLADATEALYLIDEQAGLLDRYGSKLPDPVLSVYGTVKEAMWSWNHGGDYCSSNDLMSLAKDPIKSAQFASIFSEDCCGEFKANPVKFFESRPIEQQIIMARMANTTSM